MDRLLGLDALRGMAAVLVLVHHVLTRLPVDGYGWAASIISTVDLGKLGVLLFFLISGFVIPFSFQGSLAAFGIGRAARLLPALWLSILLCLLLGTELESGSQLFANAFMLTHFLAETRLSGPYWTLNWELYFYVIAASAFAVGRLHEPRTFGLLAVAFAALSPIEPRLTYLVFMFVGASLRMVLLEKRADARMWLAASLLALAWGCSIWAIRQIHPPAFFVASALTLPTFLLLWRRPAHSSLLWLGKVSYSLYLFHQPILLSLGQLGWHPLASPAIGIPLSLLTAALVYRWVEKPMMSYGKAACRRVALRPLPASVGA